MTSQSVEPANLPAVVGVIFDSTRRRVVLGLDIPVPAPQLFSADNIRDDHPLSGLAKTLLSGDSHVEHIIVLEQRVEIFFPIKGDFRKMLCQTFGLRLNDAIIDAQNKIIETTNRMIRGDQQES